MDKIKFMCWKCGKNILHEGIVSRNDVCTDCGADLKCCRNCAFYSPDSHYECRETIEDPVNDKEKANFCDSFKLKSSFNDASGVDSEKQKKARADFDALFSI